MMTKFNRCDNGHIFTYIDAKICTILREHIYCKYIRHKYIICNAQDIYIYIYIYIHI
jgi:hypothetical protein